MIRSKFCEDISSNEKDFFTRTLYPIVQYDISKTERLLRVYINRQTDKWTDGHCLISSSHHADHICIYFMGSPTFLFKCYKFLGKLYIPCSGYKKNFIYIFIKLHKCRNRQQTSSRGRTYLR